MPAKDRNNQVIISPRALVPFDISGETVAVPAGAAGTVVDFFIERKPITDSNSSWFGGEGDTSLVLSVGVFTTEVSSITEDADMSNGDYWVNYLTGRCRGKKATTGTSETAAYTVFLEGLAGGGTIEGELIVNGRFQGKQGTDVASATNIVLPDDGNSFELTGTTKVDLISNIDWQEGSEITLVANESVVIDNATASSSTNITIILNGAGDYSMTALDTLTLQLLSTTAGGQAWTEVGRSAN